MPGKKKIGAKRMTMLILVTIVNVSLVSDMRPLASGPSTIRMSCVHRAMMRAAGVSSSHLYHVNDDDFQSFV